MKGALLVISSTPPHGALSLLSLLSLGGIARALLSATTGWIVAGAAHFVAVLGHELERVSVPDFGAGFVAPFHEVVAVGAALALPFLLLAVGQAIVRQDLGLLLRAAFVRLPAALLLGASASELVGVLVGVTDACCNALVAHGGASLHALIARLVGALSGSGGQAPGPSFAGVVLALVTTLVALALWIELAVRSAAISVATLFLPLVLAGLVWSATAQWARRLAETLVALVLAKLVVVGVLVLAASSATTGAGWAAIASGLALLIVAALAPFAVLRLVPIVELGAIGHLEGLGRRAVRQAAGNVGLAAGALAGRFSGGGATGGGVEGPPVPQAPVSRRALRATLAEMARETGAGGTGDA